MESLKNIKLYSLFIGVLKWLLIVVIIGVLTGSITAFFLKSLDFVTDFREINTWIIWLLPIGGLTIGLFYHYYGQEAVKGNNLLLESFHNPVKKIPLRMLPLVLFGTLITHLFGGSAGREGTAVQMGGAIAHQFTKWFKLNKEENKIVIIIGISAGFAAVFGTPIAGAIFAIEVIFVGKIYYKAIIPSFFAAFISNFICLAWGAQHTLYKIDIIPVFSAKLLFFAILAGTLFGITATFYTKLTHFFQKLASLISYAPLRPFFGGILISIFVFVIGTTKYIGLGIPIIQQSFDYQLLPYDFFIKILITAFTLGFGFKGGEVTPLFFIGATLGNTLSLFLPLPVGLLAGMGFVAVFAGATKTPLACTIMGIELFGIDSGIYIALACFTAFLFSSDIGIYSEQVLIFSKKLWIGKFKKLINRF